MVMGLFFAINGLRQAIIQPNLARMAEYIRLGTLDFLLTKPISSQFMVSFRHVGIYNWLDPILGLGLVAFGLIRRGEPITWAGMAGFLVLGLAGVAIMYALALAVQCLAIWSIGSEGLDDVIQGMVEAGRFPVDLYRGIVRGLLTFIIPVAMLTTFPAEALLGREQCRSGRDRRGSGSGSALGHLSIVDLVFAPILGRIRLSPTPRFGVSNQRQGVGSPRQNDLIWDGEALQPRSCRDCGQGS